MGGPGIKQGWLKASIYLLALPATLIFLDIPARIIVTAISAGLTEILPVSRESILPWIIYQAVMVAGVTAMTLGFRKFVDDRDFISLGFYHKRLSGDLNLGLITGFCLIGSGFLVMLLSGSLVIEGISADPEYLAGSVVLCLLISWLEEISFRGYILNNLMDSFAPYGALIVSAIIFALFHLFNPGMSVLTFINLFLAGILLGVAYMHTGTIWFALSLHFSWNFFQGPVFGFPVSGIKMEGLLIQRLTGAEIITGGNFGFEGSIICTLLIIPLLVALERYYNNARNNMLKKNS
jgi:uncharacterized protein